MSAVAIRDGFYVSGGTMSEAAPSYVERSADEQLFQKLNAGLFCYVLNSRQMGKSSLCVRTKARLEIEGVRTVFVDLTKIGGRNVTVDQWYAGIAFEIGRSLGLRPEVVAYWKENDRISPMQKLFECLHDLLVDKITGNLVVFIDEIDSTRSLPFDTDEFFAGIRECYNRRVHDSTYSRLTFCIMGVAVPSDLIRNSKTTPFNIGERIYLKDFTVEEALLLAKGLPAGQESLVRRVHYWTNGHPFLTQSLCTAILNNPDIKSERDVDALVERELLQPKARETNINLADVGNRVLTGNIEREDPDKYRADVLSAYAKVLKGRDVLADDESNRVSALLKLSGLMRSEGKALKVRNRIYERVFDQIWIKENMPGQELRRQKRAFILGVLRTSLVAAIVIGVIGYMAYQNYGLRVAAEETARKERYQNYVSTMNFMPLIYGQSNITRMHKLLAEHANDPWRGIEWTYWDRVSHPADAVSISTEPSNYMNMSPDGKEIVMPKQNELWFFDSHNLSFTRRVKAKCGPTTATFWFPDSKSILVDGAEGKSGEILSASDGRKLKDMSPDFRLSPFSGAISNDCRFMLAFRRSTFESSIYEVDTGKAVRIGDGVLSYSPDGRLIAHCGVIKDKFFVNFLDAKTLKVKRTVPLKAFFAVPLFSADGKTLLGSENDRTVIAIDVATGRILMRDQLDADIAARSASSAKNLVVSTRNGKLITYDLKTFKRVWDISLTDSRISVIACSSDGRFAFAVTRNRNGFLVDLERRTILRVIPEVNSALFLTDNSAFVTAYSNLALYKVDSKDAVSRITLPPGSDGQKFRQIGSKEVVTLRDKLSNRMFYELVGDKLELKARKPKEDWLMSAQSNYLCLQERGKQFVIRDFSRGQDLLTLEGPFTDLRLEAVGEDKVAFSRDARTIEIWNHKTKKKLGEVR